MFIEAYRGRMRERREGGRWWLEYTDREGRRMALAFKPNRDNCYFHSTCTYFVLSIAIASLISVVCSILCSWFSEASLTLLWRFFSSNINHRTSSASMFPCRRGCEPGSGRGVSVPSLGYKFLLTSPFQRLNGKLKFKAPPIRSC